MTQCSPIGIATRTRLWWTVLALLSIIFHVGLAAVHCHDLEGFQGKIGYGQGHFQNSSGFAPTDDDENSCVICQLLSVYKGTAPQALIVTGATFVGLIVMVVLWQNPFVPQPLRRFNRPRDPPPFPV